MPYLKKFNYINSGRKQPHSSIYKIKKKKKVQFSENNIVFYYKKNELEEQFENQTFVSKNKIEEFKSFNHSNDGDDIQNNKFINTSNSNELNDVSVENDEEQDQYLNNYNQINESYDVYDEEYNEFIKTTDFHQSNDLSVENDEEQDQNIFLTDENEEESLLNLNNFEKKNTKPVHSVHNNDSKMFNSALLALFYSAKLNQSSFKKVCEFLKIMSNGSINYDIPTDFNQAYSKINTSKYQNRFIKFWYCKSCGKYFKKINNKLKNQCIFCQQKLQMDYKLNIHEQIKTIVSRNDLLNYQKKENNSDSILDVYDGKIYKNILNIEESDFFTLLINSDGISLCEKSNLCIWPIILTINELPIEKRFLLNNVIIAGLTVSFGKPDLNFLLNKITNDLCLLEYGINLNQNFYKNMKFFLIYGIFDKPARASILNMNSSYGYYGCLKCVQKGERLKTESGSTHIYPFINNNPDGPKRNKINYKEDLKKTISQKCISRGVKGDCLLSKLKYFNPVENTNIDAMHTIFLGVVKLLFTYWFDSSSNKDYCLKHNLGNIDTRLKTIRPPSFVPTAPRTIYDWKLWRAHEYMVFIIYYAIIVFKNIMRIEYFNHVILLIISIEHLYTRKIKKDNIQIIKHLLIEFVSNISILYDPFILKSGVHELLHLCDCTLDFGPLNYSNCFQFEEINRKITSLIFGQNLVGEEFIKLFSIWQEIADTNDLEDESLFSKFINENSLIKTSNNKKKYVENNIRLSKKKFLIKSKLISQLFQTTYNLDLTEFYSVESLYFNNIFYSDSSNTTRFLNYCISEEIQNRSGLILKIILLRDNIYFFCQQIIILHNPFYFYKYPILKSHTSLCRLVEQYFLCNIKETEKCFFHKLDVNISFISNFQFNHLFC